MRWNPFRIAFFRGALGLAMLLLAGAAGVRAANEPSAEETEAFRAAVRQFEDKIYDLAEKRFAEFVSKHPDSTLRSQAVLFEAGCLSEENKPEAAEGLLNSEMAKTRDLADRFHFALGENAFKKGDMPKAAAEFARVTDDFPRSELAAEAIYQRALAVSKTADWKKVSELLGPANTLFNQLAATRPDSDQILSSRLLLAEADFNLGNTGAADQILKELGARKLSPLLTWRQQHLVCRLNIARGQLSTALALTTNLIQIADSIGQRTLKAEAIVLQGQVLEEAHRQSDAAELYERSLDIFPPSMRRHALLKVIDLTSARNAPTNVAARLEAFIQQNPGDEVSDVARLTLGELRLKQAVEEIFKTNAPGAGLSTAATNALFSGLTNFIRVIEAPVEKRDLDGRALLDEGWCFWFLGDFRESAAAFQKAGARLPRSTGQGVAKFKLADSQFRLGDFGAAQTNYHAVVRDYAALAELKNGLFDQALYQLLRTSLALNDPATAQEAVRDLVEHFPGSAFTDRSLLIFGQTLGQTRRPDEARRLFSEFVRLFPKSPLRPEVDLALAQTFMEGGDYAGALRRYQAWVAANTNHPALAEATFSEALAADKAGFQTNSFALMTNFLASFQTHSLAPLARKWLADFYYNLQNYTEAEKYYQELYLNPTNTSKSLAYEARLMAGRAAYARQGANEAAAYFKDLLGLLQKDTNAPADLPAQTYLFLGDALLEQFLQSTNKSVEDLGQAITAFNHVTNSAPGSIYEARALGRIGDCHFQFGVQDTNAYAKSLTAYESALACPGADLSVRSQAEVKIGVVLERQKLKEAALLRYLNVVYEAEPGRMDSYWVFRAAVDAARLYEESGQLEKAITICERLARLEPGLRPGLDKRIAALQDRLAAPSLKTPAAGG